MTIAVALKKAKKLKKTISSKKAQMMEQDYETLVYWMLLDPDYKLGNKIQTLIDISTANDWEIDE